MMLAHMLFTRDAMRENLAGALLMAINQNAGRLGATIDEVVARFAQCQQFDLGGQLRNGSRFLDLSAKYIDSVHDFRLYHGDFLTTIPLKDSLMPVLDFVNGRPDEVVILALKLAGDNKRLLWDRMELVRLLFGPRLIQKESGPNVASLKMGSLGGKNVLLIDVWNVGARGLPYIWTGNEAFHGGPWDDDTGPLHRMELYSQWKPRDGVISTYQTSIGADPRFWAGGSLKSVFDHHIEMWSLLCDKFFRPGGGIINDPNKYNRLNYRFRQFNVILKDFIGYNGALGSIEEKIIDLNNFYPKTWINEGLGK